MIICNIRKKCAVILAENDRVLFFAVNNQFLEGYAICSTETGEGCSKTPENSPNIQKRAAAVAMHRLFCIFGLFSALSN